MCAFRAKQGMYFFMTNEQLLEKLSQDMKMRNFSLYTYNTYMQKTKEMIKYFNKPLEEVAIEELRNFLYEYLLIISNQDKSY